MTTISKKYGLLTGLLLLAAGMASASNTITFQVDMSQQISAATFDPLVDHVYARGSFNGFPNPGGLLLTNNPAGSNPALYTGTTNDTVDANGAQLSFKYATDSTNFTANTGYETTGSGNGNRLWVLGTNTTVTMPYAFFSDAGPQGAYLGEFRVDMAAPIFLGSFDTNSMIVEVQGDFEGWSSGYTLTNDPSLRTTNGDGIVSSNVYVGIYSLVGDPGQLNHFKYVINNSGALNYEQPAGANSDASSSGNRFVLIDTNQTPQLLPIVNFSDVPLSQKVTNDVVFQVDMSVMRWLGILDDTNGSVVNIQGAFNGWSSQPMTNDPAAANTNIYKITVPGMVAGVNTSVTQFKFLCSPSGNSSYEPGSTFLTYTLNGVVENTQGGNRSFNMPKTNGSTVVLPVVYYGDVQAANNLPVATTVKFSVSMTNAVTGTNGTNTGTSGYVFNPASDSVYINGANYPVPTTANTVTQGPGTVAYADAGATAILPFLMTNDPPGSLVYSIQIQVPPGYPVRTGSYRYSIGGTNNEASPLNSTVHRRYIRSLGSFIMPLDIWRTTNSESTAVSSVNVGPKSGGTVPVTWLGRHGFNLQVTTNLLSTNTVWQDLPSTDATSGTNYPVAAPAAYFRLVQPLYYTNY